MTLIATDIDGTILPRSREFSARTHDALAALKPAGIPLVLVTARPPRWVDAIADALAVDGLAVCANGAVVYDLTERRIVEAITIDGATLVAATSELRGAMPDIVFAVETTSGISLEPTFPKAEPGLTPREVAWVEQMDCVVDESGFKLLGLLPNGDADAMLEVGRSIVGDLLEASHSSSVVPLLELAPRGQDKATGLARQAMALGVDAADVIAFGDAPNDLPMLAWAGRSYAVANAHPAVLAAADHVTESVDDDGVARVIEQLLATGSPS